MRSLPKEKWRMRRGMISQGREPRPFSKGVPSPTFGLLIHEPGTTDHSGKLTYMSTRSFRHEQHHLYRRPRRNRRSHCELRALIGVATRSRTGLSGVAIQCVRPIRHRHVNLALLGGCGPPPSTLAWVAFSKLQQTGVRGGIRTHGGLSPSD